MQINAPERISARFHIHVGSSGPLFVRAARHWVGRYVEQRADFHDIMTVAAELIANAVEHTRSATGSVTIDLLISIDELTLIVRDDGATSPPHRRGHDERTTLPTQGRGLVIIDALASAWGVHGGPNGRSIWVRFINSKGR